MDATEVDRIFWATVCKTVRPMLSDRCLSVCPVLSVCNVGALWPNGWMDQDETWRAGRPRPRTHCVRWRPSSPPQRGTAPPQFLAHICCGQRAAWVKMPLGMEVGVGVIWIAVAKIFTVTIPKTHRMSNRTYLQQPREKMSRCLRSRSGFT